MLYTHPSQWHSSLYSDNYLGPLPSSVSTRSKNIYYKGISHSLQCHTQTSKLAENVAIDCSKECLFSSTLSNNILAIILNLSLLALNLDLRGQCCFANGKKKILRRNVFIVWWFIMCQIWLDHGTQVLDKALVQMLQWRYFVNEINVYNSRLSKTDYPP